jgi:arsenite methyltransferase
VTTATSIREAVRTRYAAAAESVSNEGDASCCGTGTVLSDEDAQVFGAGLYDEGERGELPDTATMASLGCGNPTAVAELRAGETVLDLGSAAASTCCSPPSGSVRPARHTDSI